MRKIATIEECQGPHALVCNNNNNNNNNNNGSSYIAHFTMSQCALQSVEDFFGLHITAPLAAEQLTIMRDI
jgi:hypothetical protein